MSGESALTHILAKPLKVSVNETVWEEGGDPVKEHNSWYDLRSPEITITEEPAATYSVYIVPPVNGTVKVSKMTGIAEGEEITLTVTPDEGYDFAELSVLDVNLDKWPYSGWGAGIYKFAMPACNVGVEAKLNKIPVSYTISYDLNGGTLYGN